MKRRLTAALAATCALFVPTLVGADDITFEVDGGAAALERDSSYLGWGLFSIPGSFELPRAIGQEYAAVAIESGRLVRIELRNADVTVGDPVPGPVYELLVSDDGQRAFTYSTDVSGDVVGEFDLATMELVREFDVQRASTAPVLAPQPALAGTSLAIDIIPGSNRLLSAPFPGVVVYAEGVALPGRGPQGAVSVRVLNASTAVASTFDGLVEMTLGATGVESWRVVDASAPVAWIHSGPGSIAIGDSAWDVPAFDKRPATVFDFSVPDPGGNVRYGRSANGNLLLMDPAAGSLIVPEKPCSPQQPAAGRVATGGSALTTVSSGSPSDLVVENVQRRCGSYGEFVALDPARIFDSRSGQGLGGEAARIEGGDTVRIKVHGEGGVPLTGVESVVLNVTAVDQTDAPFGSFVTVWPAGFPQPEVANLNVVNGEIVGNMVTVSTADNGFVELFSLNGSVDITVDVMGYFSSSLGPAGSRYIAVPQQRLLDTRTFGGPLRAGPRRTVTLPSFFDINGFNSIDRNNVVAAVFNVTVIDPSAASFLAVFPSGAPQPDASSMNFLAGRAVNRLVTVKVNSQGAVDILNAAGRTDVAVDLVGVYATSADETQRGRFVGAVPFRFYDSRDSSPFPGDGKTTAGSAVVFSDLFQNENLVVNLIATEPEAPGYLSAGADESPELGGLNINTSSLNYLQNQTIGNQSIISTGGSAGVAVFSLARSHMIIDYFGYYTGDI